jgi:hypothetical protein
MNYSKSVSSIAIFRIAGFLFFLILLAISNFIIPNINNNVYTGVIQFLNLNLVILSLIFIIGMISDIMWVFNFPFNILAPVVSSVLSVYIVTFLYKIFGLISSYTNISITLPIELIITLISFIVLIVGYLIIFARHGKSEKDWEETKGRFEKRMEKKRKNLEWEDIGNEFKHALYNIGKKVNESLGDRNKRRKKKR